MLQKMILPIVFSEGLNQKIDPKTLQVPGLLELINGVKKKQNRISKRFGYNILGTEIEGGGSITSGEALGIFQNELNLYSGTKLYSYSSAINKWREKGKMVSVIANTSQLLRNNYQQSNITSNTLGNISVYAWEDSRGGVRYSVYDQNDGTILVSDASVDAAAARPRIVAFGDYLIIFYTKTSDTSLRYKLIAKSTPSILGLTVAVNTNMNATPNYDAVVIDDKIFVVNYNSSSSISIRTINNAFTISSEVTITGNATQSLTVIGDQSSRAWVAWNNGTDVRVSVYSYLLSQLLAPTVLEVITDNVKNITGTVVGNVATFFYEVASTLSYNQRIRSNTMTLSGTSGTATSFKRSVGLASKAFVYNGTTYVGAIHESEVQASYFVISEDGTIVAKLNDGIGGVLINNNCLSQVSEISSTLFLFSCQVKTNLESENSVLFSLKGVSSTTLDFSSENKFQNTELGQLLIVGGILQSYDGANLNEHGFHLFPENVSSQFYNSGGGIPNGIYQYSVCFEWTDNLGDIHRSAPLLPITVTISDPANKTWTNANVNTGSDTITITAHGFYTGMKFTVTTAGSLPGGLVAATDYFAIVVDANTIKVASSFNNSIARTAIDLTSAGSGTSSVVVTIASKSVMLTIPTLRLTGKSQVRIVVYRTENLGTEFRRTSSVTSPLMNDSTVDSVTFTDTIVDSALVFNELIYTTGGVLENIAPPACSLVVTYRNRVFLLDEDGKLWYSKKKVPGRAVEFSDLLTLTPSTFGGRVKAMGVIDSNFILLKDQRAETFAGDGPNSIGVGVDYGDPQLITTDTGCNNPNSVEYTPDGIQFKSSKGIYLINRALQAIYIGANVEDYNSKLITSTASLPKSNQIRAVTNDDTAMIYDYYFKQWSTFSNHTAEDTAIWKNNFLMLKANGQVWQESEGYQDGDQPIVMTVTTPWISTAGIHGFQRIWRMILLGEYKSPHKLKISVGYDFNPYYAQIATVDINDVYVLKTWGEGSKWGVDPKVWGGEFPLYAFKLHLTKQKCTSIRFRFEDDQSSLQNFGEGLNLTSITLECGVKEGTNKMRSKNSFATVGA